MYLAKLDTLQFVPISRHLQVFFAAGGSGLGVLIQPHLECPRFLAFGDRGKLIKSTAKYQSRKVAQC